MKKMRKRIVSLAAAIGLGIGMVATNTPAFASQGPAGYLTFWDGCNTGNTAGYCGATWALTPAGGLNVCHAVPTGSNDKFSAMSNQSGHNFRVWTAAGCTGSSATLYNGTETGELDAPFNNSISSQQRIS
jgi:hypothetical protein